MLRRLYLAGASSRLALAANTMLSPATVGNVISEMLRERIVVETGQVESEGGRPAVRIEVNPKHAAVVGVDVGETGSAIELFDLTLHKLAAAHKPLRLPRESPASLVAQIAAGVEEVIDQAGVARQHVLGIGVGVPGVVVHDGDDYVHAPSLSWDKVPLLQLLQASIAIPVILDNGAKTMGQAEMWFGAGRDARNLAVVLLGTGVGAALFNDGSLYRGSTSSAGEWGHTSVMVGGRPCRCGAHGCLEAYVGAESILERWVERSRKAPTRRADQETRLKELLEAANRDRLAKAILDETAVFLGAGMANLVNLFNPDRIVVGGWVGQLLGPQLLGRIRDAAAAQALRYPFSGVSIELGRLGPDAVAMGAATLVIEKFLASGGRLRGSAGSQRAGASSSDAGGVR